MLSAATHMVLTPAGKTILERLELMSRVFGFLADISRELGCHIIPGYTFVFHRFESTVTTSLKLIAGSGVALILSIL